MVNESADAPVQTLGYDATKLVLKLQKDSIDNTNFWFF